ncbi:hypothetical protein [Pseudobacter ginsenosidimutans]|uniref:DUF4468 domain-containing protein n=1 Tax=Pseudobacter ginsenosidimutans TaxID=661488 RepID=A0A4Q7MEP4_9BACT|nr:hypothetical protein [Pseudobacter ginsenosidimutans]QEC42658.1 hypothetical protein FSB84_13525 [Pseudobacter ginsenosidimutans]RZS65192.1 hypothetical protein EV199_5948 [Pseudobacter ginsenosidimutans]
MLRMIIPALLLTISQLNFAQTKPASLKTLCALVDSRVELSKEEKEKYNHQLVYRFEEKIYKLANVEIGKDSAGMIRSKVQQFWIQNEEHLTCDALSFNVAKGSIIKFAISRMFDDFIEDIIEWGVALNKVDTSDNRTVLDYIADEQSKSKGTALEPVYIRYYKQFRTAGAKHRKEL